MVQEKDVLYIAGLSRIHLREEEIPPLTQDLEKILDYVGKLEKLKIEGVEPTSHVLPLKNVFRNDIVQPSLSQEEALQNAVEKHDGAFQVPKVIE